MTCTWYDDLNRPVTVTTNYVDGVYDASSPDEDLTSLTVYDSAGRVAARVRLSGTERVTTAYEYDVLGRQVAVIANQRIGESANRERNVRTEYGYDALGRQSVVTDAAGNSTHYTYTQMLLLVKWESVTAGS